MGKKQEEILLGPKRIMITGEKKKKKIVKRIKIRRKRRNKSVLLKG